VVTVPVAALTEGVGVPRYAHEGDAGCDLVATMRAELAPSGGRAVVTCGIAVAIPEGFAGFVLPRSGLAANHGVTCLNAPGLIDSGYRGEVRVVLLNTDPTTPFVVEPGDRIAQLVVQRVERVEFLRAEPLEATARGAGGFGSTGTT
jgi:dUTP pyrophosphatase